MTRQFPKEWGMAASHPGVTAFLAQREDERLAGPWLDRKDDDSGELDEAGEPNDEPAGEARSMNGEETALESVARQLGIPLEQLEAEAEILGL